MTAAKKTDTKRSEATRTPGQRLEAALVIHEQRRDMPRSTTSDMILGVNDEAFLASDVRAVLTQHAAMVKVLRSLTSPIDGAVIDLEAARSAQCVKARAILAAIEGQS